MSYSGFAQYYDALTEDVDYTLYCDYFEALFLAFGKKPEIVLDAACGTGSLSLELCKRGYSVIGLDSSIEMLTAAKDKAYDAELDILFLAQDLSKMDLYGTVDAVICFLDSLNHITDEKLLLEAFCKIALFLHPEGIFIFDVNTVYKHREVLADSTFVSEAEELFCVWRNALLEDGFTTQINLDFFAKTGDNQYIRSFEQFDERAYTHEELSALLSAAGLEILAVYGDLTQETPNAESQRNFYVVKKLV
ncbi:MAG: class I SAM-dependent methyltransferase [Oscillospiraceae bacterium]|jgi:SAM-dependent methyltransferase|nr:class I SAM-dependent methyltransferase [Oscillospiraceae bacterium]